LVVFFVSQTLYQVKYGTLPSTVMKCMEHFGTEVT
jgi:hypothetical protein